MKGSILLVGCILIALVSSTLVISQKQATESVTSTVPRLMRFSGVITNTSGGIQTGVAGVTFSLYKDQEGGAPLWIETQNVKRDSLIRIATYAIFMVNNIANKHLGFEEEWERNTELFEQWAQRNSE